MAKQTEWVKVACTPEIKALLEQAAEAQGLSTSAWIRSVCVKAARQQLKAGPAV